MVKYSIEKTHYWKDKVCNTFPALKVFINKFGDGFGSIYDIPEECVKQYAFKDQFHWALIAEYYEVRSTFL